MENNNNNNNNNNKKNLYGALLIILLILTNAFLVFKVMKQNDKFENYEHAISAINDSVRVTVKNGVTYYEKKAPEINLDQLINSEFFKSLAADQQKFYKELKGIKGLVSATQADLRKQGEVIASMSLNGIGNVTDAGDSLKFKYGQELAFNEKDTTKNLQWKANIALKNPIDFKLIYDYRFNIMNTFERQKDKSIVVKYHMDDPELKVNEIKSFIIPKEEKRTRLGRWIDHNKREFAIVGGAVIFLSGAYTGVIIAK